MTQRQRYLMVCTNLRPAGAQKGSCAARGSVELHAELKELVRVRGLAATEVRACTSSCLDACWAGPAILVEPDHYFYGRVSSADLPEIVAALEAGGRVERLVLEESDFLGPKEPDRTLHPV